MKKPSKNQIMQLYEKEIIKELERQNKNVFTEEDINRLLDENRQAWKLPVSTTTGDLLLFLYKYHHIKDVDIKFPQRTYTRYLWGHFDILELACSLAKDSYISHYTAAFHHDLTDSIVKTIYVNKEQTKKQYANPSLEQHSIDQAFQKETRTSKNVAIYDGRRIYLLNGKHTNKLGVQSKDTFQITNVERTLIDIAVRPNYSGGIQEVLNIYKNSIGSVSVNKIYSYLKKLNFIYPYHQSIGFLLEKAGYKESSLQLLEKFPQKFDFYLSHNMKNLSYSKRWKLYYPRDLS
ncbi:type IV toxin-antitoxin system AbiEi family antitoxin domain-containing protein [Alkalicoccus saliphilus]|uniref:Uncharacterized protein n=1 Tax=Alkalicoccus saliphilus TaxID=200989 RepID=A0A2T4U3W7_9BACI|nr:type IV toxin-antitoxin system AbiEi family antitoxin [Alkalicoccus saliphilus]PTL38094.1 hypothetical protein C6Y45_12930 [Alkalicoccus saliphilus]